MEQLLVLLLLLGHPLQLKCSGLAQVVVVDTSSTTLLAVLAATAAGPLAVVAVVVPLQQVLTLALAVLAQMAMW